MNRLATLLVGLLAPLSIATARDVPGAGPIYSNDPSCAETGSETTTRILPPVYFDVSTGPFDGTRTCPDGSTKSYVWAETVRYESVTYRTTRERKDASGNLCSPQVDEWTETTAVDSETFYTGYVCPGECCEWTGSIILLDDPPFEYSTTTVTEEIQCPDGSPGIRTTATTTASRTRKETVVDKYDDPGNCQTAECNPIVSPGACTPESYVTAVVVTETCP